MIHFLPSFLPSCFFFVFFAGGVGATSDAEEEVPLGAQKEIGRVIFLKEEKETTPKEGREKSPDNDITDKPLPGAQRKLSDVQVLPAAVEEAPHGEKGEVSSGVQNETRRMTSHKEEEETTPEEGRQTSSCITHEPLPGAQRQLSEALEVLPAVGEEVAYGAQKELTPEEEGSVTPRGGELQPSTPDAFLSSSSVLPAPLRCNIHGIKTIITLLTILIIILIRSLNQPLFEPSKALPRSPSQVQQIKNKDAQGCDVSYDNCCFHIYPLIGQYRILLLF